MAEETIISFTPTNWITVIIMVAVGFTVLGFLVKLYQSKKAAA